MFSGAGLVSDFMGNMEKSSQPLLSMPSGGRLTRDFVSVAVGIGWDGGSHSPL